MPVQDVTKVHLIASKELEIKILEKLQGLELAHIDDTEESPKEQTALIQEELSKIELQKANVKFALDFLLPFSDERLRFIEKLRGGKIKLKASDAEKISKEFNHQDIAQKAQNIETSLNEIANKKQALTEEHARLKQWEGLLYLPVQTLFTKSEVGSIPLSNYPLFIRELEHGLKIVNFETIFEGANAVSVIIVYLKEKEEAFKEIADKFNFEKTTLEYKGADEGQIPKERLLKIEETIARLDKCQVEWEKYRVKLTKNIRNLKIAFDYLTWEKEKLIKQKHSIATRYFIHIALFVEDSKLDKLKRAIHGIDNGIAIIKGTAKIEDTPVTIKNNNILQPFETVTNIYGMPKYDEVDPTPFLAPFFIVFFGIALTDAGYGLLMIIASIAMIKILKLPREKQGFFRLIAYAGLFTTIIGALFGGWFGIDTGNLPAGHFFLKFINLFKLIDPINDTLIFLGLSFGLGILQIWASQAVQMYASQKVKNKGGFFGALGWFATIPTAILVILSGPLGFPQILSKILTYLLYACLIFLIFAVTSGVKNILGKILIGPIIIMQSLIGYVSDMLSYSRLMALGLATGIIALIMNQIAVILRDLIPGVGWVAWVLVIIGGHLFNLGMNALGAFIHSGRLQYVEFFPKFMKGGGKRFKRFGRETQYVEVLK